MVSRRRWSTPLAFGLSNQGGNYEHSQQDDKSRFELHFRWFSLFWFPAMKFYRGDYFHVLLMVVIMFLSRKLWVTFQPIFLYDWDVLTRFKVIRRFPQRKQGVESCGAQYGRHLHLGKYWQRQLELFLSFSLLKNEKLSLWKFLLRPSYTVDPLHNLSV